MAKKKRKGVYARDIDRLNVVFAIVAIVSLLSVGWMIWDDFARQWKDYQRRFRVIEREVTRQQLDEVQAQVDQERLQELRERRDRAEQELADQQDVIDELEARISEVETRLDDANQRFRFARSIYDARRYEYEEAALHADSPEEVADERQAMEAARRRVQETEARNDELERELQELTGQLSSMREEVTQIESELTDMNREIDRLRTRLEDLRFDWVYYVRNAPILDAFNPSLEIEQVVLEDLTLDLNFATAPRVDRCQTCHLGIASPAYEGQAQPFTSHPRLDLFVADTSPHPVGEFGCTSCHLGKGRATSFVSAVHMPDNASEEERWVEEYGWEQNHLWEWPMRSSDEIEAGCLKCHIDETWQPEAPKLERGLELIENLGCYGCHAIERYEDERDRGPSLENIAAKTDPAWAYRWVMDPKEVRPDTSMPRFFDLANTSDEYWRRRNRLEAGAIVAYLFDASEPLETDPAPGGGDPRRGQELFETVGCMGCHVLGESVDGGDSLAGRRFTGRRRRGPNLAGVGSKVSADWLATWLRNPMHVWPETRMPNLRLTDREVADLTAFLQEQTAPEWEETELPEIDPELLEEVVLEYLAQRHPGAEARERLDEMDPEERRLYLGEQLIGRYGCFGCHVIPGFENRGRIGVDLSDWGSKPVSRLDFGLLDMPHERRAWLEQKLRSPRIYDRGKVKGPQDLLRMPNFELTGEEIDALATAILAYTDETVPVASLPEDTPRRRAIEAGRDLVDEYNCRTCHIIEGRGGDIREVIIDRRTEQLDQTAAAAAAYAPPNLNTEGAKVQPRWLYEFLRVPDTIRPWLQVRMPTFGFTDEQLNVLTRYFSALDDAPYPFEERFLESHSYPRREVRIGGELAEQLRCFRCHVRAGETPPGSPDNWAPDLALAADRLRYDWVVDWMADPQAIMPGTRMPQFYPDLSRGSGFSPILDRDPRREIEALAAYVMSIGNDENP